MNRDISQNWIYIGSDIIEKSSGADGKITGTDEIFRYIVTYKDGSSVALGCDEIRKLFVPHPENKQRTQMVPSLPYQGLARRKLSLAEADKEIEETWAYFKSMKK